MISSNTLEISTLKDSSSGIATSYFLPPFINLAGLLVTFSDVAVPTNVNLLCFHFNSGSPSLRTRAYSLNPLFTVCSFTNKLF